MLKRVRDFASSLNAATMEIYELQLEKNNAFKEQDEAKLIIKI